MSKYYDVYLYKLTVDWTMGILQEVVGKAVVKKGIFFAKGLDGKRYRIANQLSLDISLYDYDNEDFEQDYLYYSEYEGEFGNPYQQDSLLFKDKVFVKREEFVEENEISSLELTEYNSELVTTRQKVKSFIKNRFKK